MGGILDWANHPCKDSNSEEKNCGLRLNENKAVRNEVYETNNKKLEIECQMKGILDEVTAENID